MSKFSDVSLSEIGITESILGLYFSTLTSGLNSPYGVAVSAAGNIYFADTFNHRLGRVTSAGVVNNLSGFVGVSGSADGLGQSARFNLPHGIAVSTTGNSFVADTGNHTIRKLRTLLGISSTIAGTAGVTGSTDGTGSAARFNQPAGVAVDTEENVFVADTANHTIRKVTSAGVVTTIAGTAGVTGSADDTGSAARFDGPTGIAVDTTGNLFVADRSNHTIRKVTSVGVVTTLAGLAGASGSNDGTGSVARFNLPYGTAVDTEGNVYVADTDNHTIRKVTSAGVVTTIGGTAGVTGSTDGFVASARFNFPHGVAVSTAGDVFVADSSNNSIRSATQILSY